MQYYRCKCGAAESWGSMGPDPCYGCAKCGTTLDLAPNLHRDPIPHEMIEGTVMTDDGEKPLTRCRFCQKTRASLLAAGQTIQETHGGMTNGD